MKKPLFPEEFIRATIEYYHFKISKATRYIYLVLLSSLIIGLCLTPVIHVDVSRNVRGQISSASLRHPVYAPRTGQVTFSNLKENQYLHKDDTVLKFQDASIIQDIIQLDDYRKELAEYMSDLTDLSRQSPPKKALKSTRYQLEYRSFLSHSNKLKLSLENAKKIYERQQVLFKEEVIAQKEYEAALHSFQQAEAALELYIRQSKTDWQKEAINLKKELSQANSRRSQLLEEGKSYTLLSPKSGTFQNVHPVEPGQFVQAGIKIGEISPGDSLVAICFVSPTDIGLLKPGQVGAFRIDAYDYNEWGMIHGEITEISEDAYLMENTQPLFRVNCKLNKTSITLNNGYTGRLKKGMTFNASFKVANRSIYDLLFDKVDDWMNPNYTRIASK